LGSTGAKAAHRTMMKLTPAVNFINILRAAFAPILFCQKIKSQTIIREKLHKTLKMLMKLTSVVNFSNILQSLLCQFSFKEKVPKKTHKSSAKTLLFKKDDCKMSMKLSPVLFDRVGGLDPWLVGQQSGSNHCRKI